MSTISHLVEYLLAAERPGGGHLVRFGGVSINAPIFPAGMSVTMSLSPTVAAFASIQYYLRWSPAIVPDAFDIEMTHAGIYQDLGNVNRTLIAGGHNSWVVITAKEPATIIVENVSGVDQAYGLEFGHLIVDTSEDLDRVTAIVKGWGSSDRMEDGQSETNELLRKLIAAVGGTR